MLMKNLEMKINDLMGQVNEEIRQWLHRYILDTTTITKLHTVLLFENGHRKTEIHFFNWSFNIQTVKGWIPLFEKFRMEKKEFLFCAERWHFLTPQLSASLSSNWEVQLNCCSNARWCKNFEATILNTVMHSVLRKAWKCLNFSEKCWKWRNYFKDTNFL